MRTIWQAWTQMNLSFMMIARWARIYLGRGNSIYSIIISDFYGFHLSYANLNQITVFGHKLRDSWKLVICWTMLQKHPSHSLCHVLAILLSGHAVFCLIISWSTGNTTSKWLTTSTNIAHQVIQFDQMWINVIKKHKLWNKKFSNKGYFHSH